MRRIARRLPAAAVLLLAACASPYEDPGSSGYVLGTIFVLIGVGVGIALILGLKSGD